MESTTSSSSSSHRPHILNHEDAEFERRLDVELSIINPDDLDAQSALTMSPENSDSGSGSGSDIEIYNRDHMIEYRSITYRELEAKIKRQYIDDEMINEIDVLKVYVKNQKNIYTEATHIMNTRLYYIAIPSTCISICVSAITSFVSQTHWGVILITSLNAALTVFIILMVVLKLETKSVKYDIVASKYFKLQEELDDFSSKLAFVGNKHDREKMIFSQMKKLDNKITEIKDENRIALPYYIQYLYPKISSINIFSSIHSVELHRKNLINLLKGVINETRYINAKWDYETECGRRNKDYMINGFYRTKEKNRLQTLADMKASLKIDISKYKNTCSFIDGVFQQEINTKKQRQLWWFYNLLFGISVDVNDKVLKFD